MDVLVLTPKEGLSNPVKIPLSSKISVDKIWILVKTLGPNEQLIGSVSIPQHLVLNGGIGSYT